MNSLGESFLSFLYPPVCLHCRSEAGDANEHFCHTCSSLLQIIDPEERCPCCFSDHFCKVSNKCPECVRIASPIYRMAAAYEYMGPAATLIKKIKYGNQPYFTEGLGAAMAVQWTRLGWQTPDYIVPVPVSFSHWLERGYNQSFLLAEQVSKIIGAPVCEAIRRRSGDYSQAGLTRRQRLALEAGSFYLDNRKVDFSDKCLLLIDDVITTGSTLRKCAEVLLAGHPGRIYALAACRG